MTVACKMAQCPYHDPSGYCGKPLLICVDQMGMCNVIWKRGQRRQLVRPFSDENYKKKKINIIDGEIKEEKQEEEEKVTNELVQAGTSQEDPPNEDAASEEKND